MGIFDDGAHPIAADGEKCPDSALVKGDWELALVLSERWALPLPAHFTYCACDPYAVCLDFYLDTENPVRWIFARDLLTAGLACPVGDGDVRVLPDSDSTFVNLRLRSGGGDALFEIPVACLTEWLGRTYRLVPAGQEHRFVDLNALIEHLLPERAPGRPGSRHGDSDAPRPGAEHRRALDGDSEGDGRGTTYGN